MLAQALTLSKTYRKRYYKNHDIRGQLVNRCDIDERPQIVEECLRIGDYESNTVVGKEHKGALFTLIDRTTREAKIKALPNRQAIRVKNACIELLKDEQLATITFDNGKEFVLHQEIENTLNIEVYFAKPYHSWERGTNENTNGLIRQFLPENQRLDNIDESVIRAIEHNLNNRPRKVLGYRTPLEVKSNLIGVALRIII